MDGYLGPPGPPGLPGPPGIPGSATLFAGGLGQMMNVEKGPNYGYYGYYQRAYQQSYYSGQGSSKENAVPKVLQTKIFIQYFVLFYLASFRCSKIRMHSVVFCT